MLRFTSGLLGLRPRQVGFAPPPLIRRPGTFACKFCKHKWSSENVWVTEITRKVYQGETCVKCGTTNKPIHVGSPVRSDFINKQDRAPNMGRYQSKLRGQRRLL